MFVFHSLLFHNNHPIENILLSDHTTIQTNYFYRGGEHVKDIIYYIKVKLNVN